MISLEVSGDTTKMKVESFFCKGGKPDAGIKWEKKNAEVKDKDGNAIFQQKGVSYPQFWSQQAINIVSEKYFAKTSRAKNEEKSLKELAERVCGTIRKWAIEGEYLDEDEADVFCNELMYMIYNQVMAFNSPVFFNIGLDEEPMISACFIQGLEDSMGSIMELVSNEARIFQNGGGTGTNFSVLRSSTEPLSKGGIASGPVSFMKGFDAFAGVIKSGGRLRRAAKMIILDVGHPDVEEFIWCKALEEKRLQELIRDGEANFEHVYNHTYFQNGNNSVRIPNEFFRAVKNDGNWYTKEVVSGKKGPKYKASEILGDIAKAAHICGDPGVQYHTTINDWNTLANSGEIVASNPCSEFMSLNDSACNLASLNLMKFVSLDKEKFFDIEAFRHAVQVTILAQEILIDRASYPTPKITEGARKYRQLGLGYANLGGALMALGHPYDSDFSRSIAAAITSLMTSTAYDFSADIAVLKEPFQEWELNKQPFIKVMNKHIRAHKKIIGEDPIEDLLEISLDTWNSVVSKCNKHGIRNSQVTLLAPTGTIGFMMDVATTGVEPDIALVKSKVLVGGGAMQLVNPVIPLALKTLHYKNDEIKKIQDYVLENGYIEGAPGLLEKHLPIFDCAIPLNNRCIEPMGHIRMMAAVQPFLSGAISKTVNLPENVTIEEIKDIYLDAWKMGLKSIAVYRQGSKIFQPLMSKTKGKKRAALKPLRRNLPDEIKTIRHKFDIIGHKGYIHVGLFEDGSPGELFIRMAKAGSTINGLMDNFGIAVSLGLQYGVPLDAFITKFENTRFEPQGWTKNSDIQFAKSILDYIFRWLKSYFYSDDHTHVEAELKDEPVEELPALQTSTISDGPPCPNCGFLTTPNGTCYRCPNCGNSLGCS